jgi:mono/diheme cytochrome c family protein
MSLNPRNKNVIFSSLLVIALLFAGGAWFGLYKFYRDEPEPQWASEAERFKYGTIGAEAARGIPYYIWLVLPRVFPEYVPGPGGYKAFGVVWEEGREMPVGFTKRVIGFPRVANNCAICHTSTWRRTEDETPQVVVGAPAHSVNIQELMRFLINCGRDPRFTASNLLAEIDREVKLSLIDRLIYRFALIPLTRSALQRQHETLKWMNRPGWPEWGRGRDDPMNLTKYFMTSLPVDNSTGQADFPSVWNLKIRKGEGLFLNWSCDTPSVRSVLIDSALGLGGAPDPTIPFDGLAWSLQRRAWFLQRMEELDKYMSDSPPPAYPFAVDASLASKGKAIYAQQCASCHDVGARYTSKPVPHAEIGTDPERAHTWSQAAADEANRRVKELGIDRINMVRNEGYISPPLDGLWMRAPYLHNGSVPTLRDLLAPVAARPKVFHRGYDVYDPVNVGFVTSGFDTKRLGWKHDTAERGNGNQGHLYGIALSSAEKDALIEYLKTL